MNQDGLPKDHYEDHLGDEPNGIEANIKSKATWLRFLFMLIMSVLFSLACTVGSFVVLLQFFWVLFTGETKDQLLSVGRQLAAYLQEIVLYLSFNTEERPFPFDKAWPSA